MMARLLTLIFIMCLIGGAAAGPWEDGIAAYKSGDYQSALRLWKPLAEKGEARAQNNLGVIYEEGRGVPADVATAADWYRLAAQQGHAGGRKNLADLISRGLVPPEPAASQRAAPAAIVANGKVAGVGDVVLRVETSEPLPNLFGGADIFGRRRPTGVDVLQFAGLIGEKAIFIRSGVSVQSNATTMTETPRYVPLQGSSTFSGNIGGTPVFGNSTSSAGVWVPPRGSQATSSQLPSIEIEVDWRSNPVVVMDNKRLVIREVTETTLAYEIQE